MVNESFRWECQPRAEALIETALHQYAEKSGAILHLQEELRLQTSTRLFDWLDHVIIKRSDVVEKQLIEAGFVGCDTAKTYRVFNHPGAQLPWIVLDEEREGIVVKVESIADYLMVRGLDRKIEGTPLSGYRRCLVSTEKGISLFVAERRSTRSMEPTHPGIEHVEKYLEAIEKWKSRDRNTEAMGPTLALAEEIANSVGKNMAAWTFLEVERLYWQSRNHAGLVQKGRQDHLGMGWANHDHHTFRSSRRSFNDLVRFFEILGFHCRERFYAGEEAGWGAQVMENSICGLVLFLDVDLAPHELAIDFAHQTLTQLPKDGTIGLWCALHGDSILKSGMHHLEAQFSFEELTTELGHLGISMMNPFSDFPYLKQAFTHGEVWKVDPARLKELLAKGKITAEQATKFEKYGAVGSHLENLQRREGYKGFNQKNVSIIIKETDPRTIKTQ